MPAVEKNPFPALSKAVLGDLSALIGVFSGCFVTEMLPGQ